MHIIETIISVSVGMVFVYWLLPISINCILLILIISPLLLKYSNASFFHWRFALYTVERLKYFFFLFAFSLFSTSPCVILFTVLFRSVTGWNKCGVCSISPNIAIYPFSALGSQIITAPGSRWRRKPPTTCANPFPY